MKWITRERPKIDRIACPWLIKNFVDKDAEFIYVPKDQVFEKARELDAIPYDLPGAEYTHEGDQCTFDYIVKKHNLSDPAVRQIATIVREVNNFVVGPLGLQFFDDLRKRFAHDHHTRTASVIRRDHFHGARVSAARSHSAETQALRNLPGHRQTHEPRRGESAAPAIDQVLAARW